MSKIVLVRQESGGIFAMTGKAISPTITAEGFYQAENLKVTGRTNNVIATEAGELILGELSAFSLGNYREFIFIKDDETPSATQLNFSPGQWSGGVHTTEETLVNKYDYKIQISNTDAYEGGIGADVKPWLENFNDYGGPSNKGIINITQKSNHTKRITGLVKEVKLFDSPSGGYHEITFNLIDNNSNTEIPFLGVKEGDELETGAVLVHFTPNGFTGSTGATGATGDTGLQGNTGIKGDTGAAGADGTNGAKGDTGAAGANGTNGAKGATGAAGADGTNGAKGDTGAAGADGTNGAKGDTGAAGANGAKGATGAAGADGTNGTNGAKGDTGAAGIDGAAGVRGFQGATGSNALVTKAVIEDAIDRQTLALRGSLTVAGDITAFSTSDKRLKTNIKLLENPLEKLKKINGYSFDWIEKKEIHSNTGSDIGVLAQEIAEVLKEATITRDNGYMAVRYDKIIPLLINCIKCQQQQIDQLKIIMGNK